MLDRLEMLGRCAGNSLIFASTKSGLVRADRQALLSKLAPSVKKTAIVVIGEPGKAFKEKTHKIMMDAYASQKACVEKRIAAASVSGETLTEREILMPPEPSVGDDVWFLPHEGQAMPDMTADDVKASFGDFSLPVKTEGFDRIEYAWYDETKALEHLRQFILKHKATVVVESLKPGERFLSKLKDWKEMKKQLQQRHAAYLAKQKQAKAEGTEEAEPPRVKLDSVEDIHDTDGKGTPVYASFRYEDWLILSYRYELHLLAHGFACDIEDKDRPAIPEMHVAHYFKVYFGTTFDPQVMGKTSVGEVVKLLKAPCELAEQLGGTYKGLASKLDMDTATDTFIKMTEEYRRDRQRRLEAGDESSKLSFPRPQKQAKAKVAPAKAIPQGAAIKRPVEASDEDYSTKRCREDLLASANTPAAKALVTKGPVAKVSVAKSPVAKASVGKVPGAKAPVAKVAVAKSRPVSG